MLKKFALATLASVLFVPLFATATSQVENQPQVIEKALQLQQKGILRQKHKGHLYLEISKEFVAELLPLIQASDKISPPWFMSSKKGIGAHIEVVKMNERLHKKAKEIKEVGQEFAFTVKEVRSVKTHGGKTHWFMTVDSPQLEKLRESYGLSPKLKDRDFSIMLGSQAVPCKTGKCPKRAPK
jgi:Swiss Army Knife, 2H phosphoesterase domain